MSPESLPPWVLGSVRSLMELVATRSDLPAEPEALATWLYVNWYLAGTADASAADGFPLSPERLVARLRAAAPAPFETGWSVVRECPELGPGTIEACRGTSRKVVAPIDYVIEERPFAEPKPGLPVAVCARCDAVAGGFYRTWSPAWAGRAQHMARVYWSVSERGLVELVALVTQELPCDLSWLLKAGVDSAARGRPDSVVLYVRSNDVTAIRDPIRRAHQRALPLLLRTAPAFARPLGPGIAVAEDPEGPCSFGEHRCQLIADVVLARPGDLNGWVTALDRAFAARGLDLRAPDRRSRAVEGP